MLGQLWDKRDTEGLERVQGRERSWEGAGEFLRELGKGLRLEQRRLRGALVALHEPLTGGGSRGGRALLAGNRDRRRGNGLRLGQGRLRVDIGEIPSWEGWSGTGTAAQGSAGVTIPGGI